MKKKVPYAAEKYRITDGPLASNITCGFNGAFLIPYKRFILNVMVSDEEGWDHVSISVSNRIPTWYEMKYIKELFWEDYETVVQFHPCKDEYVNDQHNVLHLWKKQGIEYVLPPKEFV